MGFRVPTWLRLFLVFALVLISFGLSAFALTAAGVSVGPFHGDAITADSVSNVVYDHEALIRTEGSWFPPWGIAAIFTVVVLVIVGSGQRLDSSNTRHKSYHGTAGGLERMVHSFVRPFRKGGWAKARGEEVLLHLQMLIQRGFGASNVATVNFFPADDGAGSLKTER